MSSIQWFYFANGERVGPVTEPELVKKAQDGLIKPEDHVWNPSMGDEWVPASTIPTLFPPAAEPKKGLRLVKQESAPESPDTAPQADTPPPQQTVVTANFTSVKATAAPTAPAGGSFFLTVVLPVLLVAAAAVGYKVYQGHRADVAAEKAEADYNAAIQTEGGYAQHKLQTQMSLTFITYFDAPGRSGLYLKGRISNIGSKNLSNVRIWYKSGGGRMTYDVGPVQAGKTRTLNDKVPKGGMTMGAHYTMDVDSVTFAN